MSSDSARLARKYPGLKPWDIDTLVSEFQGLSNLDFNKGLPQRNLVEAVQKIEPQRGYDEVRSALKQVSLSRPDVIEQDEFIEVIAILRENDKAGAAGGPGVANAARAFEGITSQRAYERRTILKSEQNSSSAHTINEDEREEFTNHINLALAGDSDIGYRLPIDPHTMQLFDETRDGLILSKLINYSSPETIDERVLNRGRRLSPFQMTENNNVVINSAKAIGCSVVNIGSQDLAEGREHLILGLIWQIIKIGLFANIDIKLHPELYRLLEEDETLEDFLKLPADAILLRWFNYHLAAAGWHRRVSNFSSDIKDSENYTVLLSQLVPSECSRAPLHERDLMERAEQMLQNADRIGCRRYVSPKTVVNGNPKLNLAFVAHLFNTHPCLEPLEDTADHAELDDYLFHDQYDREARAFALWLNSLNVDPFVNYLFEDIKDGIVLLQAFDKIFPGSVNWKKVNTRRPLMRFKQIENTNMAVDLGHAQNFSLVGIQGADITDGVPTLVLAIVWQLMRANILQTLASLSTQGHRVTDQDMIQWANRVASTNGGSSQPIRSFNDPSLASGRFLLDVLNGMKSGIVDPQLVTAGQTEEDMKMNAKYAISIARKLGATIFLLPEDIVEVKPKMILTFIGSLMAIHQK
ncbi:fimbrin [Coemansia sp. RSA 989]|nr:fimbrin [Coemansia mojavensis]KAJ1744016.1 fimbrin [Coemansia sp. RSA 1086]KAJ1753486.1 fimbrin [Coemansia sp. RSA 1821]KAJ1867077.1 fimbrin [Coemansia sp. RSA 989]KAJ2632372.1 fimbrin [Coemansia sp. RSA 1290]KAJ2651664.1 fimbrin [Coemansia sp. RSA 1250]KAJ2676640.1 fimbrin [Coemansia sp. RSA 1085]